MYVQKMVLECQQHPDYQEAITTLLDLADEYGKHSKRLASGGTGTVKETRSGLAEAEADLKVCIPKQLDILRMALKKLIRHSSSDSPTEPRPMIYGIP